MFSWFKSRPNKLKAETLAHAQGVLAYEGNTGYFIVHSFPLYPAFLSSGLVNTTINYSQMVYGQNMMCVSVTDTQLFNIAGIMSIIQPIVYHKVLLVQNSNITLVVNDVILNKLNTGSYSFNSNGITWNYLSKSSYSNSDFWDTTVAYYYQQGLSVQSWGRPYMPSLCPPTDKYSTLNVANLKIGAASWTGTNDHSK